MAIQPYRKYGSTFRPFPMKIEQNMCKFMNGINSRDSSLLKRFFNPSTRRENGNYYDPCPLSVILSTVHFIVFEIIIKKKLNHCRAGDTKSTLRMTSTIGRILFSQVNIESTQPVTHSRMGPEKIFFRCRALLKLDPLYRKNLKNKYFWMEFNFSYWYRNVVHRTMLRISKLFYADWYMRRTATFASLILEERNINNKKLHSFKLKKNQTQPNTINQPIKE